MIPRRFMYVYFIGTAAAFLWLFINLKFWCPDNSELELEMKKVQIYQQKLETQKTRIDVQKLRIDELQTELRRTERNRYKPAPSSDLPKIYIITPTYARPEQKAELTRLSYTLDHVTNIHWIVVEDSNVKTVLVKNFLSQCNVPYTHLSASTPTSFKLKENDPNWFKPRGVLQRNAGISWIRKRPENSGVVYFADDDNTYNIKLFEEMRYTKKVSVWPVGLVGYLWYESPVIKQGKVVGWYTYWKPDRKFATDMAGFAVSVKLMKDNPMAEFLMSSGRGNLESDLLTQLGVSMDDLEPRADNCTKVLVWHTRTEKPSLKNEEKMVKKYGYNSSINIVEV